MYAKSGQKEKRKNFSIDKFRNHFGFQWKAWIICTNTSSRTIPHCLPLARDGFKFPQRNQFFQHSKSSKINFANFNLQQDSKLSADFPKIDADCSEIFFFRGFAMHRSQKLTNFHEISPPIEVKYLIQSAKHLENTSRAANTIGSASCADLCCSQPSGSHSTGRELENKK